MAIELKPATAYYSQAAGRRYFTKKAAIGAEARAIIKRRYPTEQPHSDESGRLEDPGFHWEQLPRSDVMHRRLCRLIEKSTTRSAG